MSFEQMILQCHFKYVLNTLIPWQKLANCQTTSSPGLLPVATWRFTECYGTTDQAKKEGQKMSSLLML